MRLASRVIKNGNRYEVDFIEGGKSSCSADVVEQIADETGEEACDIAEIVVRIQTAGNVYEAKNTRTVRFSNKLIKEKLPIIIESFGAEQTLEIIEDMKHHELEQILNSINPLEELDEF